MKTILAIWHSGDKGKTETLREFANLLLATYPLCIPIFPIPLVLSPNGDIRLVVKINGRIIGVESWGDPTTKLKERLIDLADSYHCEIILCSTRTKGDTVKAVENLHNTRGFEMIWTSTYQIDNKTHHAFVNRLKAKHLLDLLIGLSLI